MQEFLTFFRNLLHKAEKIKGDDTVMNSLVSHFLETSTTILDGNQSELLATLVFLLNIIQNIIRSIEELRDKAVQPIAAVQSPPRDVTVVNTDIKPSRADAVSEPRPFSRPNVDMQYVQLLGDKATIDDKISKFIRLKQMDNDAVNIQEFCGARHILPEDDSCARTQAAFQPRVGKHHVIVKRAINQSGPQTTGTVPVTRVSGSRCTDTLRSSSSPVVPASNVDCSSWPTGVGERLSNMEAHLKLYPGKPVPSDIYERLQSLENRILYLESSSPEYFSSVPSMHNRKKRVKLDHGDRKPFYSSQLMQHERLKQEQQFSAPLCQNMTAVEIDNRILQLKQSLVRQAQQLPTITTRS